MLPAVPTILLRVSASLGSTRAMRQRSILSLLTWATRPKMVPLGPDTASQLRTPLQMGRPMRLLIHLDVDGLKSPC